MNETEIRAIYLAELTKVAPDIDPDAISSDDHIQEDLELDSMDVLNFVTALHARTGVNIPDKDYPRIASVALAVAYFLEAMK